MEIITLENGMQFIVDNVTIPIIPPDKEIKKINGFSYILIGSNSSSGSLI